MLPTQRSSLLENQFRVGDGGGLSAAHPSLKERDVEGDGTYGELTPLWFGGHYKYIVASRYKYLMPRYYKSIVPYECKYMLLH